MAGIVQIFRAIEQAALAADPAIAGAAERVRQFGDAGADAVRQIGAAAANRGDGGGGGDRPAATGPDLGGGSLPRGFLGPGAPAGGGPGRGSAGGGGGFLSAGSPLPSGAASGGGAGASAGVTNGLQRVEGAVAGGLQRLANVPTAGERVIVSALGEQTAMLGRVLSTLTRGDGGASGRARWGVGP